MKINSRSPYYIYDTVSNLTTDRIDIYIYTGTQTPIDQVLQLIH